MFPQGILSQAYFMCALVGGGFLVFNFVMGHLDADHGDAGDHGGDAMHGGHDGGHHADDGGGHGDDGGGHGDDGGGHGDAHGDGDGDGHSDHADGTQTTNRYGPVPMENRLQDKLTKLVLSLLSPMSIAIFLAFFGLAGYATGYLMPMIGYLTLIPAVIAGFLMINIFKAGIRAMMRYGTSSSHIRQDDIVGHIAEVLVPIAENRPGQVTYIVQSKIYNSVARSKPGVPISKGSKVMIVETDGPTVYVEPYKELNYDD